MLRFVIALPLIGHGLAHISGVLAAWTSADVGFKDNPWIFSSGVRLCSGIGRVWGLIWLLAGIVLAGSGVGLILRQAWWLDLALLGSVLSLVAIVPWWKAAPPGAKIGVAFDLLLIIALATPIRDMLLRLVG
jgi:hypothetical protein